MSEKHKELTKKQSFLIALSNFLQKNRIFFIILIAALIIGLITFTVVREVSQNRIEKSTLLAETVVELYGNWVTEIDDAKKDNVKEECLEKIEEILDIFPKHYASQRAYFIKGNIFFEEEKWAEAGENFEKLFQDFPESYLSPIALNNAAVAYEENGNIEKAIDVLAQLSENYRETYSDIARIFFSIGRLSEEIGDITGAETAYNTLVDDFSNSNWTKLARNRIIALTVSGYILRE